LVATYAHKILLEEELEEEELEEEELEEEELEEEELEEEELEERGGNLGSSFTCSDSPSASLFLLLILRGARLPNFSCQAENLALASFSKTMRLKILGITLA
jgi:hypothetical protein